jgi:hypothetical protein
MDEQLKVSNKRVRTAQLKAVKTLTELAEAVTERALLQQGAPSAAVAVAVEPKQKKNKDKKTAAAVAAPAAKEEDDGPVECAGNFLLETRCPLAIAERKKAADTKEGKDKYPTCKKCKRAIAATRAERRAEAAAEEEAAK